MTFSPSSSRPTSVWSSASICGRRLPSSARHARAVITMTEYTRNTVIERLGVPPRRVVVVPPALGSTPAPGRTTESLETQPAAIPRRRTRSTDRSSSTRRSPTRTRITSCSSARSPMSSRFTPTCCSCSRVARQRSRMPFSAEARDRGVAGRVRRCGPNPSSGSHVDVPACDRPHVSLAVSKDRGCRCWKPWIMVARSSPPTRRRCPRWSDRGACSSTRTTPASGPRPWCRCWMRADDAMPCERPLSLARQRFGPFRRRSDCPRHTRPPSPSRPAHEAAGHLPALRAGHRSHRRGDDAHRHRVGRAAATSVHVVTALPWYRNHRVENEWRGRLVRHEATDWGRITRVHPFPTDKRNIPRGPRRSAPSPRSRPPSRR